MLTRRVRISEMNYLNIQNRSQCSFGCAIKIWRVKYITLKEGGGGRFRFFPHRQSGNQYFYA